MLTSGVLTFYYKTWRTGVQSTFWGVFFKEIHSGGFYYGNGKVWSATAQYGYKGWHACDQGSGFGYSIKVTSCIERPRPDLGANVIAEYDYFQVHVVAKGVPIYDSKSSWANLYPSGAAYFHWAN